MRHPDLEQIAEALRHLQRAALHRTADAQRNPAAEEPESQARSLLHAILDRHGLELQDLLPPALTEQRRARLVAAIERGAAELLA